MRIDGGEDPPFIEQLMSKLIPALIRSGDVRESAILLLADSIEGEANGPVSIDREEDLRDMATMLRAWVIEASDPTPPPSHDRAKRLRNGLRLINNDQPPSV